MAFDPRKYGAIPAVPSQMASFQEEELPIQSKEKSLGGFIGNIGKSSTNLLVGLGQALLHPIKTVQTIGEIGAGAVEKVIPGKQESEQSFDALVDYFKERYKSPEALMNTIYEDPAGFIVDASTVLTGGGAAVGKLGQVTKIGALTKAGATLGKVGVATARAPLTATKAVVSKLVSPLKKVPELVESTAPGRIAGQGLRGARQVLPSISKETSETIAKYPQEVQALARQQTLPVNPILAKTESALKNLKTKAVDELTAVKQSPLTQSLAKNIDFPKKTFFDSTIQKIEEKFAGLKINKDWKIAKGPFGTQERSILNKTLQTIKSRKIKTLDDVTNLKSELFDNARSLTPPIGQKASKARAVFNELYSQLDNYLPESLKEANKLYSTRVRVFEVLKRDLLPQIKGGALSRSAINRIKSLLKEENLTLREDVIEFLKKETGFDLEKELSIFNAAREINPNLIPQDMGGVVRSIQKAANPAIGQFKIERALRRGQPSRFGGKINARTTPPFLELLRQSQENQK